MASQISALQQRMREIAGSMATPAIINNYGGSARLFGSTSYMKPGETAGPNSPSNYSVVVISDLTKCTFPNGKLSPDGNSISFSSFRSAKIAEIRIGESCYVNVFGTKNEYKGQDIDYSGCSGDWNTYISKKTGSAETSFNIRAHKMSLPSFEPSAQIAAFACAKFTGSNAIVPYIPPEMFPPKDYLDMKFKAALGDTSSSDASSSSSTEKTEEELKKEKERKKEIQKLKKKLFISILPEYLNDLDTPDYRKRVLKETGYTFEQLCGYVQNKYKYWVVSFPGTLSRYNDPSQEYPNLQAWHASHTGVKYFGEVVWGSDGYVLQNDQPKIFEKTVEWPFELMTVFKKAFNVVFARTNPETGDITDSKVTVNVNVFGKSLGPVFGIYNPKYQHELLKPILHELPMCMLLNLDSLETSMRQTASSADGAASSNGADIIYLTNANKIYGNVLEFVMQQMLVISCKAAISYYNRYIVDFAKDCGVQIAPKDLKEDRTNPTILNNKIKSPNPFTFLHGKGAEFSDMYSQNVICLNETNIGVEQGTSIEDDYFFMVLFPSLDKESFREYFDFVNQCILPQPGATAGTRPSFDVIKKFEGYIEENTARSDAIYGERNEIPYIFLLKKEIFTKASLYDTAFCSFNYHEHNQKLDDLAAAALNIKPSSSSSSSSSSSVEEPEQEVSSAQEVDFGIMDEHPHEEEASSSSSSSSSSQPKKRKPTTAINKAKKDDKKQRK